MLTFHRTDVGLGSTFFDWLNLTSILKEIVARKWDEIAAARRKRTQQDLLSRIADQRPPSNFLAALKSPRCIGYPRTKVALIAEIKKASPSRGVIRENFDPVSIARTYCDYGADCLSVLTDEPFFQGHLDYLRSIRSVVEIPLLRKDFIVDDYQVFEARSAGADAVLLIAECLDRKQLLGLFQTICGLGMTALVELYDERNLDAVLNCNPDLVGVNNRDLHSFDVDFERSIRIKQRLPSGILVVSESGIQSAEDVRRLEAAEIGAMLVGESLMRSADIGLAVRQLLKVNHPSQ